jgi:hypothetical protein
MVLRFAAFFLMAGLLSLQGQTPAASPTTISADVFKGAALPFGFRYGGKDSKDLLGTWQTSDSTAPAPDGNVRT